MSTVPHSSSSPTQSFILFGTTDVKKIPCQPVEGKYVVLWKDIEHAYPGVQYVKNGKATVSLMRDSRYNR